MSKPIESYALIGDGEAAALVARDGAIDWLCWPGFDDDACFSALLGTRENGCWSIAPRERSDEGERRYRGDSLILETLWRTEGGLVRITDFMPVRGRLPALVRIVEGLSGTVEMAFELAPRFDYGALPPWWALDEDGAVAVVGRHRLTLRSPVPVAVEGGSITASFAVPEGKRLAFVLSRSDPWDADDPLPDAEAALTATQTYWEGWIGGFDAGRTRWPAAVKRSLLTLKALTHARSGGLIAAPTTSLPEVPAGAMNWDYRFSSLRDSTFTLGAFINAGFTAEATAWRDWLLRAIGGEPEALRIMYRVDGSRHLEEWTVDALPGYREARPVRVGNAASTQQQLDIYGEVLDTLALARRAGIAATDHQREIERRLVAHLGRIWRERGAGIWESRGDPKRYTYAKAMCWVGFDRALRHHAIPEADLARLTALRAARPRAGVPRRVGTLGSARSPRATAVRPSTRASSSYRSSGSCRRTTRAWPRPSPGSVRI